MYASLKDLKNKAGFHINYAMYTGSCTCNKVKNILLHNRSPHVYAIHIHNLNFFIMPIYYTYFSYAYTIDIIWYVFTYHICNFIFFPSSSIVRILKSIPEIGNRFVDKLITFAQHNSQNIYDHTHPPTHTHSEIVYRYDI